MPESDTIYDAVKSVLIKAGWTITADLEIVRYEEFTVYADIAAERPIAAERDGEKIVVEVKSFIGVSKLQDLKEALRQYDSYFHLLEITDPERKVYVAVSEEAHTEFFSQQEIQFTINKHKLPLIVVDLGREEIVRWIN